MYDIKITVDHTGGRAHYYAFNGADDIKRQAVQQAVFGTFTGILLGWGAARLAGSGGSVGGDVDVSVGLTVVRADGTPFLTAPPITWHGMSDAAAAQVRDALAQSLAPF